MLLPYLLIIGLFGGAGLFVFFLASSTLDQVFPGEEGEAMHLSEAVLEHKPMVARYAEEYGIEQHVGLLLALMMQESGGRGKDPMQASESLCGSVGCIQDPEVSIEQGVKYFAAVLEQAEGDIKLALQSYNFGPGFIDYVQERGGAYTQELAIDFSAMMYHRLKDTGDYSCIRPEALPYKACYGDIYYVDAVLQYYDYSQVVAGKGDWISPIAGALTTTSDYGRRTHPISGRPDIHTGMDFGCINHITPIRSAGAGKVIYADFHTSSDGSPGYGNYVIIQHGKALFTAYAHLSSRKVVKGDLVEQGQTLGICGTTGSSTGPHLHFEAKRAPWKDHMNPGPLLGLSSEGGAS
ncbi:lysozyme family protein [Thalassobacillus pellis]|uniref:lysozyme family protein n=1 Tax=Thalassobacillus pellis TaxID=748008 RepID=UPI00308425C4|nr:murein DD-endopeptidase MepM/ murein hydrolase activator NlpD [Thalassobacillus pellis]